MINKLTLTVIGLEAGRTYSDRRYRVTFRVAEADDSVMWNTVRIPVDDIENFPLDKTFTFYEGTNLPSSDGDVPF